jgi:hypothetical protein
LLSVSALLPDANLMVRWYQRIDVIEEMDAGLGLVHVAKIVDRRDLESLTVLIATLAQRF